MRYDGSPSGFTVSRDTLASVTATGRRGSREGSPLWRRRGGAGSPGTRGVGPPGIGILLGGVLSRGAPLLGALLLGVLLLTGVSCRDTSRRMGEAETLKYKRELIEAHRMEISPVQAERLLYFPGRTQGEIDAYFEKLEAEAAAERDRERSRLQGETSPPGVEPSASAPAGPGHPGGGGPGDERP